VSAPSLVDKYARAIVSMTELPRALFETCEHGAAIDVECYQCEPPLELEDEIRERSNMLARVAADEAVHEALERAPKGGDNYGLA
jgi:hypothetical protein